MKKRRDTVELLNNKRITRGAGAEVSKSSSSNAAGKKRMRDDDDDDGEGAAADPPRQIIPEPFLLHLLESFAEMCLLLETGSIENPRPDWECIVHRDLKPANIFMDSPSGRYPSYPQPRLGDFGIALITSATDTLNPIAYTGEGTPGWRGPEQLAMVDATTGQAFPPVGRLAGPTDVWALGAIVIYMMNRELNNTMFGEGELGQARVEEASAAFYSEQIVQLVERCTIYKPADRITAVELLKAVRAHTAGSDIRSRVLDADDATNALRFVPVQEGYRIGFAVIRQATPAPPSAAAAAEKPKGNGNQRRK